MFFKLLFDSSAGRIALIPILIGSIIRLAIIEGKELPISRNRREEFLSKVVYKGLISK